MGGFNESQHPRVPAGSSAGGQFTSSPGGYVFSVPGGSGYVGSEEHVANVGKRFLQKHLTRESVARMAGAPDGAEVSIDSNSMGDKLIVVVRVKGPNSHIAGGDLYYSNRVIDLRRRVIYNEESKIKESERAKGLGAKLLARQVEEGRKMGMHRIETYAAGRGKGEKGGGKAGEYNGYYSWARMGFMPQMQDGSDLPTQKIVDRHGNDLNIIRLMSTKAGRDYWKDNGSAFNAMFDLRPTSISSRVLDAYLKETGKK